MARKNELLGKYWSQGLIQLIFNSELVHLEATYKVKEIQEDGSFQWVEGPIEEYFEQAGTFSSFTEKFTWNKGNRTITVTVLEVGKVDGEIVARRVKRKYMSLRGCEYKLWTVVGQNIQCPGCRN